MIAEAWGFYHSLTNPDTRRSLLIPLMKTTRYFSLDDEKRQKLSRSKVARARADRLEQADWQGEFYRRVREGVEHVLAAQVEYAALGPRPVRSTVRAGIDGLAMTPETAHDVLITSPPYLQAQEYIRASKMDLFWLGHSAEAVRRLSKLEFPYQDVPEIPIHSDTYHECLEAIQEPHMARLYRRYFFGVLGTLTQTAGAGIGAAAAFRGAGHYPHAAYTHRPHLRRALRGARLAARGHARGHYRQQEPVFVPGEPGHRRTGSANED